MTGRSKRRLIEEIKEQEGLIVPSGLGAQYEEETTLSVERPTPGSSGSDIDLPLLIGGLTPNVDARLRVLQDLVKVYAVKVERNPRALQMLARLYEERVLPRQVFPDGLAWGSAAAMAMLAAAHFCDVDADAARLRDEGAAFVDGLRALGRT